MLFFIPYFPQACVIFNISASTYFDTEQSKTKHAGHSIGLPAHRSITLFIHQNISLYVHDVVCSLGIQLNKRKINKIHLRSNKTKSLSWQNICDSRNTYIGESWGMANDREWRTVPYLVEGVKVINCFHPRMLAPPQTRVNTN